MPCFSMTSQGCAGRSSSHVHESPLRRRLRHTGSSIRWRSCRWRTIPDRHPSFHIDPLRSLRCGLYPVSGLTGPPGQGPPPPVVPTSFRAASDREKRRQVKEVRKEETKPFLPVFGIRIVLFFFKSPKDCDRILSMGSSQALCPSRRFRWVSILFFSPFWFARNATVPCPSGPIRTDWPVRRADSSFR